MLVPLSNIKVNPRRRDAPKAKVKKLADSMKELGLINPVTLDQQLTLISGLHRLEAAKLLGWTEIECSIMSLDGIQAELAEIDENVIRNKLSTLDQGDALLRRKEIYEMLYPQTKRGGDRKSEKIKTQNLRFDPPKPFVQDTAEKLGISRRTVEIQVQTAKNLTPKAKEIIRQAGIDIGKTDALALSQLPPEQQAEAAHLYASGQIDSISDYTPGRPRKKDTPPVPALPVLTDSEPETEWKPYSIPPAQRGNLTTAETIAQLKSHNKDIAAAPWMFLENITQFTENVCRELSGYLDGACVSVFPALDREQMRYLRQRLDRMIAAANQFYYYIKGEDQNEV